MPQQSSPPYLSTASIWPRQINRWLDINAQNGPLQRTQTYITLPTFTFVNAWQGYSNLIAAYNFEGPNNISLTSLALVSPTNNSYLLCVMWIDKNNIVHRYALWTDVGEVMYIPHDLYTGQLIGKNFRLEVWTTSNSNNQLQPTPITLYTSKLGIQDYRHGIDSVLVNPDGVVTNFSAGNGATLPSDIGLLFQVDVFHNLVGTGAGFVSWTSMVDNTTQLILSGSSTIVSTNGLPVGGNFVNIQNNTNYLYTASAPNMGVQLMVLACKMEGPGTGAFLFSAYPSGIAMFWNNGVVTSGGSGPSVSGLSDDVWYIFMFWLTGGNSTLAVYNLLTGALIATNTSIAPIVGWTNAIALGNTQCRIVEAILASNSPSNSGVAGIVAYLQAKYAATSAFPLPLIFPANSVSVINNI